MTAHMVQYLLLDAELRARIMDNKMFLNVLCCLVVYLVVQVFTKKCGADLRYLSYSTDDFCGDQLFCLSVPWK